MIEVKNMIRNMFMSSCNLKFSNAQYSNKEELNNWMFKVKVMRILTIHIYHALI